MPIANVPSTPFPSEIVVNLKVSTPSVESRAFSHALLSVPLDTFGDLHSSSSLSECYLLSLAVWKHHCLALRLFSLSHR